MGKGIKTRNVAEKGIKAIDKAAVASERMKEAYIRTKDKGEHGLYAEEGSPGEYASDRVSSGVENTAREAVHQFDKQGRKGVKTTKENISKVKEKSRNARPQPNSLKTSGKAGGKADQTGRKPAIGAGENHPAGARGCQDPGSGQEKH